MITSALIGAVLKAFEFIVSILPGFSYSIPSTAFDYLISAIDKFGGILPVATIIQILGCEIAYRTYMFTAKLLNYAIRKIL